MSNSTSTPNTGLSYKDAGVDIEAGDALVDRIKSVAKRTSRPEVMGGLGGFGALCKVPKGYEEPVLVSGTDGVGTKLRLALNLNRHDTIGRLPVLRRARKLLERGLRETAALRLRLTRRAELRKLQGLPMTARQELQPPAECGSRDAHTRERGPTSCWR